MRPGQGTSFQLREPLPDGHPVKVTHLERAERVTVCVSLQDRLPQGLGLRTQQGGSERVTGQAFLRHLWVSRGQTPSGTGSGDCHKQHDKKDPTGFGVGLTDASH